MKKDNNFKTKGSVTLSLPITINGTQVSELSFNSDEIDGNLYMEAEAMAGAATKYKGGMTVVEFNTGLHLYLGYAAIIAVNKNIDWNDLLRIKGRDLMKIMQIGRSFILGSEDDSTESSSEEPSETTPGSTTHQSQTSKEEG